MDVLPLCHKVVYEPWMKVEGQGNFAIHLQPRIIPPVLLPCISWPRVVSWPPLI